MVPSRRVSLHTPRSEGFSCAIISTSRGLEVCIFPSASQRCLMRLDSQLGKHPSFPCSAPPLHQAPALHWQFCTTSLTSYDILSRKKGGTRQAQRINNPAKSSEVTQSLQQHPEHITGMVVGLGQFQRLESRDASCISPLF